MLRSCKYCGRIHEQSFICAQKQQAQIKRQQNRKQTSALRFRRSDIWTNKSISIRRRDNYLCLCCKAQLVGTTKQYNTINLSVHHIVPIEENYNLRLNDENLITVCDVHHEMCEAGEIPRAIQSRLAQESINEFNEGGDTSIVVM